MSCPLGRIIEVLEDQCGHTPLSRSGTDANFDDGEDAIEWGRWR